MKAFLLSFDSTSWTCHRRNTSFVKFANYGLLLLSSSLSFPYSIFMFISFWQNGLCCNSRTIPVPLPVCCSCRVRVDHFHLPCTTSVFLLPGSINLPACLLIPMWCISAPCQKSFAELSLFLLLSFTKCCFEHSSKITLAYSSSIQPDRSAR